MTPRQLRCPVCKGFYSIDSGLPPKCCPPCQKARDEKIRKVVELLRENPGMSPASLSHATGVPIEIVTKHVLEFLRSGG